VTASAKATGAEFDHEPSAMSYSPDVPCRVAGAHPLPICPAHHDLRDAQTDPHMWTRSTFLEGEHPVAGPFTYLGVPAALPGQPFEVQRPAPLMGADTEEIMAKLGFSAAEMEEMLENHV
jgi:crotonobetainyl-CoA:carnitine CoA-transferase CaiB-like acyl-CoA transferase